MKDVEFGNAVASKTRLPCIGLQAKGVVTCLEYWERWEQGMDRKKLTIRDIDDALSSLEVEVSGRRYVKFEALRDKIAATISKQRGMPEWKMRCKRCQTLSEQLN
jgi:hypothetical protein